MIVRALRRLDRARLRLGRAVDQRADPRVHHRADAHQARLDRHIQRRARQPVVAEPRRRGPQRHDLGVRRRIVRADRLIVPGADRPRSPATTTAPTGTSPARPAASASASAMRMNAACMDEER